MKESTYEDEIAVIELKNELLSESKSEVQRKQINFEEGNVYKGIKDVWVTKNRRRGPSISLKMIVLNLF